MMRHRKIEMLIQKRLDREITKEEEEQFFRHLNGCPECYAYFGEMEKIHTGIKNLTEFFPGPNFNGMVLARLGIKKAKILRRLIPVFGGLYIASLLILLFSPIFNFALSEVILSVPKLMDFWKKIDSIINGMGLLISSYLRFNQDQISILIFVSFLVSFGFIRFLKTKAKSQPI